MINKINKYTGQHIETIMCFQNKHSIIVMTRLNSQISREKIEIKYIRQVFNHLN